MKNMTKTEAGRAILSALSIAVGIMLIIFPGASGIVLCRAVGICALVFGAVRVVTGLKRRAGAESLPTDAAIGIILLVFGVFTLLRPEFILSILPIVLGLYLLLESIGKFQRALEMRKTYNPRWWASLVFAILTAGLGVLMLFNPFGAAEVMLAFLGLSLIFDGVADLCTLWLAAGHPKANIQMDAK